MQPDHARYDRLDVPATLDTGARRLPVVLARAGVLRYPWGVERVDAEVLADPTFTESLVGLPVVVGLEDVAHPDRVDVGDTRGAARAGTILSARFDAAQGALVGELVIDTPDGLDAVARGVRGVSLGYSADAVPTAEDDRKDGATHRRVRMYAPNHLILTLTPRGGPAVAVRADGANMQFSPEDLTSFSKRMDAHDAAMKDMHSRMDAMDGKLGEALAKWASQEAEEPEHSDPEVKKGLKEFAKEEMAEAEHRADSGNAGAWRSILSAAAAHKVELADTVTLLDARRAVAGAIVGKERADSLDSVGLDAVIVAGARRADSANGSTFESWIAASRSVPASEQHRADADDITHLIGRA
jgi:hypothetical protein